MGAAFAAGALAVYLLERYLARAQRVAPAGHLANARPPQQLEDARLRDEVRARLPGWVSHPRAVEVEVNNGVVRLSGQVLATELERMLMQLTGLRGVYKVHNALSVVRDANGLGAMTRPDLPSALH
jgi:hypothetical protein